jgi:hypothetical protein
VSVHVHCLDSTLTYHDLAALGGGASLQRRLGYTIDATAEKKHSGRSTSGIP